MRVSDRQRFLQVDSRVSEAKLENINANEQIASQKRINRISDDPIGSGLAVRHDALLSDIEQFGKNIEFSRGFINTSETALRGIQDYLIRAKELSVGLANDVYGADSREAVSKEVKQIIEAVVALANQQYSDRYVFGGFRTKTPPLSLDGQYVGDDGVIFLQIGSDNFRRINIQARKLFEASPDERQQGQVGLIASLKGLYDSLKSNDVDGIRIAMNHLDSQMEKVTSFQATLGGIATGLDNAETQLEQTKGITSSELSKIEDVDFYKAISDFKKTESVLQSTLLASNKLLQPSLLNFMQ